MKLINDIIDDQVKGKQNLFLHSFVRDNHIGKSCIAAIISRADYVVWYKDDERFRDAVDSILESRNDDLEHKLYELGMEGNVNAIKIYADARMSDRGYGIKKLSQKEDTTAETAELENKYLINVKKQQLQLL